MNFKSVLFSLLSISIIQAQISPTLDYINSNPAPTNRAWQISYEFQKAYSQLEGNEQLLFIQTPFKPSLQGAFFLQKEITNPWMELYYGSQIHWIPTSRYRLGLEYTYSQQEYFQVHGWAAGAFTQLVPGLEIAAYYRNRLNSQSSISLIWQSMPSFSTENGWKQINQKNLFFFKQNWQVIPLLNLQSQVETNPLRLGFGIQINTSVAKSHQFQIGSQTHFHPDLGSQWGGIVNWQKE